MSTLQDFNNSAAVYQEDTPHNTGDRGVFLLGLRADSDAPTANDGDYTALKLDESGRLKVAVQPGSVASTTGSITANGQTVYIDCKRLAVLSIAMVGTSLVGHNIAFEVSNDSTNGTDGNWYSVQVVRTNANIVETSSGVLTATPAYAWELNVNPYTYFRVRATAHTSGTAAYTLKPGAYSTEPVPSSQNPDLITHSYSLAGVIAINTDLMIIDCIKYKQILIQCASMGTTGVVTPAWSNDGVNYIAATMQLPTGSTATTFNAAGLWSIPVFGRYLRLRLTTATTAGTTTIVAVGSQSAASAAPSQSVSGTLGITGYPTAAASADSLANPTTTKIDVTNLQFNGSSWDRIRGNVNAVTADTGAKTASFNGATQTNYNHAGAYITAVISAVSGTSPTLVGQLQYSYDGTNFLNIGPPSTALTAAGSVTFAVYPTNLSQAAGATPANLTTNATQLVPINAPLPRTWRIAWTVGGTTPSFTFTNVYVNYIL